MKKLRILTFIFLLLPFAFAPSPARAAATGCAYPATIDSFANVQTGQILTATDYNKLQCVVEKLETDLRIPNFTVATRPATPEIGQVIYVTDAIDATTCDTGEGSTKNLCIYNGTNWIITGGGGEGGGAPTGAGYITKTSDGTLSAEFALGSLATGLLKNTTTTGIPTIAVEGADYYKPGGTDVAIADGGTGASTQAGAQTNLGVVPGTDVFKQGTFTGHANVLAITNPDGISAAPTFNIDNSLIDGSSRFAADSGSSDDYEACPKSISTMSTPAYVDKSIHGFIANTSNIGGAKLSLCNIGLRDLVKLIGGLSTPLATGDILVGQPVLAMYKSSTDKFHIISQLASGGSGSGTPGGGNTQCQFNDGGIFGGDAGCTYNKTTDVLTVTGGYESGNIATNSVQAVMGGGVSGHRDWTFARNVNADFAGTTGSLPAGNGTKFDSNGLIVDGGVRYKTCIIENDMQSATPLANANITGNCSFDVAGTLVEIAVSASGGTPSALLERWRPNGGSTADVLSGALATGSSGAYACSKTTAIAGLAGITCTNTLQNTGINAGDVVRVKSATAGGVATRHTINVTLSY